MHVPFEAIGWLHIIHRNADLLLLVSIASLGLLPLVSIYIIETEKLDAVSSSSSSSNTQNNGPSGSDSTTTTPDVLRSFVRVLIYLAILFPYLLALLSTYVSVQLVRHQGFHETGAGVGGGGGGAGAGGADGGGGFHNVYRFGAKATAFWRYYQNTKILKKEDMVLEGNDDDDKKREADPTMIPPSPRWRIPCPGSNISDNSNSSSSNISDNSESDNNTTTITTTTRLVEGDCIICMHQYQVGERIVWSSNPKCIHHYHYDCLHAWMEPYDARAKRCPCCRQPFFK